MLRRTLGLAAMAIVGGALLLFPLMVSAETGGAAEQSAQTQGDDKSEAKKENGDRMKDADQAKAAQEAQSRAMEEYREAAANLPSTAGSTECVWTGRRIASLLWRDDIDTARRYIDLYDRFGCSSRHLKLVFRCVIQQGPIDPKAQDRLAWRVHECWIAPEAPTTAATQATTESPAKAGTIPN
jgi:hypothetical protein